MPTRAVPLPDVIEECPQRRSRSIKVRFRCISCKPFLPENKQWIERGSITSHLKSRAHYFNADAYERQQQQAIQIREQMSRAEETLHLENRNSSELQSISINDSHYNSRTPAHQISADEQQMWADWDVHGADFSGGVESYDQREAKNRDDFERTLHSDTVWPDATNNTDILDEHDRELIEADEWVDDFGRLEEEIQNYLHVDSNSVEEIQQDFFGETTRCHSDGAWYPYPTKLLFLLDVLDNIPRSHIPDSLMKMFIWVLRQAGASDVPSFGLLRQMQAALRKHSGVPMEQYQSPKGNIFYFNDVRRLVGQDWACPATRRHIHLYPVIPKDGIVSEIWHAQKFHRELDLDLLSPMFDNRRGSHFYVNEFTSLASGKLVIPLRWLEEESTGQIVADAYNVVIMENGEAVVETHTTIRVKATSLVANFLDLQAQSQLPPCQQIDLTQHMPNPLRVIAHGDPLYTSWIDFWADDVSGNRSKSYNKHLNAYITHRNLPRRLLNQEAHIHFVSTSQHASVSEQYKAFKETVEVTHTEPITVYDAATGDTARIRIFPNTGPGDNPLQSEISAHIGSKGNYYCRKCKAGGCESHKASNEGYCSLFQPGEPRSAAENLNEVWKQLRAACTGVAQRVTDLQSSTGVKDSYTQHWIEYLIRRAREIAKEQPERSKASIQDELMTWVTEHQNEIIDPYLVTKTMDPCKDTPVEILHTILLGITKYTWHMTHTSWKDSEKKLFSLRLQASNADGLSIHAIRAGYIMQYANSLIGRQLKTLSQTALFHISDLVDPPRFLLWRVCGDLTALLWFPEIRNMDEYLRDLRVAVNNVLDVFVMIDPSKIIVKIKCHLLVHIEDDIRRLGPILGSSTEVFESFNGVFRQASIFSNHLAPSRDIAVTLGDQDSLKHRLTGGFWLGDDGSTWRQAGPNVRDTFVQSKILQRQMGWSTDVDARPASTKLIPMERGKKTRSSVAWVDTKASKAVNQIQFHGKTDAWFLCSSVVAASTDECHVRSWIFAESELDASGTSGVIVGRIQEILSDSTGSQSIIILDRFEIGQRRHPKFGMPTLARRFSEQTLVIVPSTSAKFIVNVQHDCPAAGCTATGQRMKKQERVDSGIVESFVEHVGDDQFIINMHALHNAHLLRLALPRTLTAPLPLLSGEARPATHCQLAERLRGVQQTKRAERQKKADEARAAAGAGPSKKRKAAGDVAADVGT